MADTSTTLLVNHQRYCMGGLAPPVRGGTVIALLRTGLNFRTLISTG